MVQSIGALRYASLKGLWRGPSGSYPAGVEGRIDWEVWMRADGAEAFAQDARAAGVHVGEDRLTFPEQIVLQVSASRAQLLALVKQSDAVTALAKPASTADFFDGLPVEEQDAWLQDLLGRIDFRNGEPPGAFVTLFDTGVTRAHPLLAPALAAADRHAADPAWALEDLDGHGSGMAGLALYGDLTNRLHDAGRINLRHHLESVKVIPDAGINPYYLLGAVTRRGVNAVETAGDRRRVFTLASTTPDDHPHDGAPTSWSTELDQLASGVSGDRRERRLFVASAGNVKSHRHMGADYHAICDHPDEELEAPSQAWNVITVGAYTDKAVVDPLIGAPLAPAGDLSPFSKTASWTSTWPLKPDVVMEGGNLALDALPPALACQDLSLLTTYHEPAVRRFTTFEATSAATALAAGMTAQLWTAYPDAWPETVRALFVSSARWTPTMLAHLPLDPGKGDYEVLFRRYGYGVPNLRRAARSAIDAVSLVIQDDITPYAHSATRGAPAIHNHIKLHALPWPVAALRRLGPRQVTLRVALSTFVEPNPAEASRGRKLQYGSHGLRFKLKRAGESRRTFESRINAAAEEDDAPVGRAFGDEDGWRFGRRRRDVGSLHIDELTCAASDLARRDVLAIHPVGGWWKTKLRHGDPLPRARYALVVEIDALDTEVDLYAEIQIAIAAQVQAQIEAELFA